MSFVRWSLFAGARLITLVLIGWHGMNAITRHIPSLPISTTASTRSMY